MSVLFSYLKGYGRNRICVSVLFLCGVMLCYGS